MNLRSGALRGAILMLVPGGALPTVAQEEPADSVEGAGLLGFKGGGAALAAWRAAGWAMGELTDMPPVAPAVVYEFVRMGRFSRWATVGVTCGVGAGARFSDLKIEGNSQILKPSCWKPGWIGRVCNRLTRDAILGSRLKGSRVGR